MKKDRHNLSGQLRAAIDNKKRHGMSRYRICKEVDLDESTMSRFMAGHCGLALDTIDALANLLGLELVETEKHKEWKS